VAINDLLPPKAAGRYAIANVSLNCFGGPGIPATLFR